MANGDSVPDVVVPPGWKMLLVLLDRVTRSLIALGALALAGTLLWNKVEVPEWLTAQIATIIAFFYATRHKE